MEKKHVEAWKPLLQDVIDSKVSELQLFGYRDATSDNVWQCLLTKVWRKDQEKRLYQVVEDIFHLNAHVFMSYLTVQNYQNDDLLASIAAVTTDQQEDN
ncbi:post-transcriptional regulator [Amphibacillus jilinensis]|uniref:post-transcriptional regulator n=1 Tax=Amphibacillus jilinensis TaxID=1216008 RepID=UPI00031B97FB|nr:post-transcriptional regulator [Amphibacillus jilinensis]